MTLRISCLAGMDFARGIPPCTFSSEQPPEEHVRRRSRSSTADLVSDADLTDARAFVRDE